LAGCAFTPLSDGQSVDEDDDDDEDDDEDDGDDEEEDDEGDDDDDDEDDEDGDELDDDENDSTRYPDDDDDDDDDDELLDDDEEDDITSRLRASRAFLTVLIAPKSIENLGAGFGRSTFGLCGRAACGGVYLPRRSMMPCKKLCESPPSCWAGAYSMASSSDDEDEDDLCDDDLCDDSLENDESHDDDDCDDEVGLNGSDDEESESAG
jgi:hypothetical protein